MPWSLVFVSARYRVPVVPVAAIPAAAGALALVDAVRARSGRRLAVLAAGTVAVLALTVIPGPFCQEQDLEGEYWFLMSAAELRQGDRDAAVDSLQRAVELDPDSFEARYQLGEMLLERDELAAPRSPISNARSRSGPTSPSPTVSWGSRWAAAVASTEPSSTSAGRWSSSRTTRAPSTSWARCWRRWETWRRRSCRSSGRLPWLPSTRLRGTTSIG